MAGGALPGTCGGAGAKGVVDAAGRAEPRADGKALSQTSCRCITHTEFRERATFLQALGGTGDSPAMPSSCPQATVPSAGTAPHPHPPHPHTPPQSEDSPAGSQARSSRGRKALSSRVLMSPSSGSSPESLPALRAEGLGPRLFLRHRGGCSAPLTRAVQAVPLPR